jgi:hypothetical protein
MKRLSQVERRPEMRLRAQTALLTLSAIVIAGVPCPGQDVEPPFTWDGDGTATLIGE